MDQALRGIALSVGLQYFYVAVAVSVLSGIFFFLKKKNNLSSFLSAWYAGALLFNLFSMSWLYAAYPVVWLPKQSQLLALTALLAVISVTAAAPFLLSGYAHFRARHMKQLLPLVMLASVSISEILRSLALSALFYAPGSASLGLHWSAGTFGNALSLTPLVELVSLGGIFILSGILAMLVTLFFGVPKKVSCIYLGILLVVWVAVHFMLPTRHLSKDGTLGVVQLRVDSPREENDSAFFAKQKDLILGMLERASATPEILVIPEDARFLQNLSPRDESTIKKIGMTTIIDGATTMHRYKLSNYSYAYDTGSGVLQGRGKWFMFPFNEYMPSLFSWIASFWFDKKETASYEQTHSYALGKIPQAFETPYGSIGTLLCSEMFSHDAIQSLKNEHASLIVLQSHLPVFHRSPWLFMSYYLIARTIAAQTRSYLIVSSTDAPALVVSPYGKIIFQGNLSSSLYLFHVDRGEISFIK